MAYLPTSIKARRPKFQQAIFVDLSNDQLHHLIEKYTTGFYPNIVFSIEPINIFSNETRQYTALYTVTVFASKTSASIADIIAEFKKLLVYHKPMR